MIALIILPVGVALASNKKQDAHIIPVSYWLWAGITAHDAPADSEYYIYQGIITRQDDDAAYKRIGLYPYPLKANRIFLVYRLESQLPDPAMVLNVFQHSAEQWQRHPLVITGLQLDFDSPTSKLLIYSDFLTKLRALLPKNYALSITGLGDWAMQGNEQAMRVITGTTDEVAFQLYQGWKPLPDIGRYVEMLGHYPLPFRVGLLANGSNNQYISALNGNPNFRGVIYFIQRKP